MTLKWLLILKERIPTADFCNRKLNIMTNHAFYLYSSWDLALNVSSVFGRKVDACRAAYNYGM